jgi:hypothetical protein
MHAHPVVEDCPPGETRGVRGSPSFYEGTGIDAVLKRLKEVAFPPANSFWVRAAWVPSRPFWALASALAPERCAAGV